MVLNDAYFSIPIHHLHRKSLRFIWRNMRVLVLAIWSEISSSDLHQLYQTPNVIPQNTESSESDLHRRFSLASTDFYSSTGDMNQSPRSLPKRWLYDKSTEIQSDYIS